MTVRQHPVEPDRHPRKRRERGGGAAAAAWALAAIAILSGLGWLYLLRDVGALRQGPRLRDALPLEQLAAHSSQPLLVVAVAFVPAGAAAAAALAYVAGVRPLARGAGLALLATVLLVVDAVVSGAVAQNERVLDHALPTLAHAGVWVEVGCVVIGAGLLARTPARARRDGEAAASGG